MTTAHPKRRFFRYSLRTLMIVVTVFCIWMGWQVYTARQQREAINAIQDLGGWAYYDFQVVNTTSISGPSYETIDLDTESWVPTFLLNLTGHDFFHDIVRVNMVSQSFGGKRLENDLVSDEALQYLVAFPQLRWLGLHESQATDEGMRKVGQFTRLEDLVMWDASELTDAGTVHLKKLRNLTHLHISNSGVTDKSLEYFSNLRRLERLSLQGNSFTDDGLEHIKVLTGLKSLTVGLGNTRITDDGLKHISELVNLERLGVQHTNLTDLGLKHLEQMENLKDLWLGRAQVTDAGLEHLENLTNLRVLVVSSNLVTDEGVKKLQQALPNLQISR